MYIHEHDNWTDFRWDNARIATSLDEVARAQGRLYGKLSGLGFDSQLGAMADNLTRDLIHSSEIECVRLNASEVRSSIARRLGIDSKDSVPSSHYVGATVDDKAMRDKIAHLLELKKQGNEHNQEPVDKELFDWAQGLAEHYNKVVESLRSAIKAEKDDELNALYYRMVHENNGLHTI